jgi:hypothetical protein
MKGADIQVRVKGNMTISVWKDKGDVHMLIFTLLQQKAISAKNMLIRACK